MSKDFRSASPPRAFGIQIGETDYCISWLPIGGYVKIAGIIDESMDTEFTKSEPQPWEYRSKPIWQRMLVMSGGVIMNIILAIGIFWYLNFTLGTFERPTNEIGFVSPNSIAEKIGIKVDDKIISLNDKKINSWDEINSNLIEGIGSSVKFNIERNGQQITLEGSGAFLSDLVKEPFGIYPAQTEAIVMQVSKNDPADKIGLKNNDVIVKINESLVFNEQQVIENIKPNAGKEISIVWKRNEKLISSKVTPNQNGMIGISLSSRYNGPVTKKSFGLIESFTVSFKNVFKAVNLFYTSIWNIITGKLSFTQSFGGPVKIAQIATSTAESGITNFLGFLAFLSINLAVMNFLPIPALDGGHMVILFIEIITRKPLSDKRQMQIQQVGWYLLLALMVFMIINDFIKI